MEKLKTYVFGAMVIAVCTASVMCFGCHPEPGTPTAKVVSCATESVKQHWPEALPAVNSCLASASVTACLLGLVNPVVGITYDTIACLVRHQGDEFARAAAVNPGDYRSRKLAAAARKFLDEQKISFAEAQ